MCLLQKFDLRPMFAKPTTTLTATDLAFPEITPAPLSPPAPDAACVVIIKTEAKLVQEQPQPIAGFFIDGLAMLGALLPTACAPVRQSSAFLPHVPTHSKQIIFAPDLAMRPALTVQAYLQALRLHMMRALSSSEHATPRHAGI